MPAPYFSILQKHYGLQDLCHVIYFQSYSGTTYLESYALYADRKSIYGLNRITGKSYHGTSATGLRKSGEKKETSYFV